MTLESCIKMLNEPVILEDESPLLPDIQAEELAKRFLLRYRDMLKYFNPEYLPINDPLWMERLYKVSEKYPPEYRSNLISLYDFSTNVYPRIRSDQLPSLLKYRYIEGMENPSVKECCDYLSMSRAKFYRLEKELYKDMVRYVFKDTKGGENEKNTSKNKS